MAKHAPQLIWQNKANRLAYIKSGDFIRAYICLKKRADGNETAKKVLLGLVNLDLNKYKQICDIISLFTDEELGKAYFDYIAEVVNLAKNELDEEFSL